MFIADRFFYRPTRDVYGSPEAFGLAFESVLFDAADGTRLHGWFLSAATEAVCGTVIHLHGNAGNITGHFEHVAWLPPAGWNVLCFDYRGYGRSAGRPTRAGLVADGHAAIDYAKTRVDVDSGRIVVLGQSLGGAVGPVVVAERDDVAGLVVAGAFSHYRRTAAWHIRRDPILFALAWWLPRLLMSSGLEPIDAIARVAPTPLLVMHGREDEIVDPAMAEELFAAAGEPKELWLMDGVGHYVSPEEAGAVAGPRLLDFFHRCVEDSRDALTATAER